MARYKSLNSWTDWQLKALKEHYGKIPIQDLEKQISKTRTAIYSKARKLKITFPFWSEEDEALVKQFYKTAKLSRLAYLLDLPLNVLIRKANRMGLRRN